MIQFHGKRQSPVRSSSFVLQMHLKEHCYVIEAIQKLAIVQHPTCLFPMLCAHMYMNCESSILGAGVMLLQPHLQDNCYDV